MKLGKSNPRHDPRTLRLSRYVPLPKPPLTSDWSKVVQVPWGVMKNDRVGDCTIAAMGHLVMLVTAANANVVIPPDRLILDAYSAVSGYNGTDATDTGAVELDVLKYMKTTGLGGHKLKAFVDIDGANLDYLRWSIHWLGNAYIGVQLTQNDMDAVDRGQPWVKSVGAPIGGHAVPLVAYDTTSFTCVTWGQLQKISIPWLQAAMDEAHGAMFEDWFDSHAHSPVALDLGALEADLASISTGGVQ